MILTWTDSTGAQYQVEVDAVLTETHTLSASVTTRPVETGVDPADHIRTQPQRLTATGMISNTPIKPPKGITGAQSSLVLDIPEKPFAALVARPFSTLTEDKPARSATVLQFTSEFDRVTDTWKLFELLNQTGQLVDIDTTLKTYAGMAIETLSTIRDAQRGNVLEFNFSAVQVRRVSSTTTEAPERTPKEARSQAPKNRGKQQPTEEAEPTRKRSILAGLTDSQSSAPPNGAITRIIP